MTTGWAQHLPVPKPAAGREGEMTRLAWGDVAVDIPARIACQICDLRVTDAGALEGLRCRDDEWVDLAPWGARIRPDIEMEPCP